MPRIRTPRKATWHRSDVQFGARKELATELGCPADLMGDSAKMNMWLHRTVLKKIADNGGNVPAELWS